MTELVLPDDLHERILDALWPDREESQYVLLQPPLLQPDGSIIVLNRSRVVLTLRSERQSRMAPAVGEFAAVVDALNEHFAGAPDNWTQAKREQFIVHALPYIHFGGTPQWGISQHLTAHLGVNHYQVPNAIRAARVAITRLIRTWDLNGGEPILQADKKSGPYRFYSPHPALKEVLREYFARHPVSHHYFGSTMAGYLEGNE